MPEDFARAQVDICDPLELPEPHEPPIGLSDGSLYMDTPTMVNHSFVAADACPHKYATSTAYYFELAMVKVITEKSDGKVTMRRYLLPKSRRGMLRVWLQQLEAASTSWPFTYEAPSAGPQIRIKGNPFLMETDKGLRGASESYKQHLRFGYEHPGYDRHFRIAKWDIIDKTGVLILDEVSGEPFADSGQDSYQLYVSFHHAD